MTSYERVMLKKRTLERQQGFLKNRIRTAEHHGDVLAVKAYRKMREENAAELNDIYVALTFTRNRKSKLKPVNFATVALCIDQLCNSECPAYLKNANMGEHFYKWMDWNYHATERPPFTEWQRAFTKYEGKKKAELKALVANV